MKEEFLPTPPSLPPVLLPSGYNWWSNAGAEYEGGALKASFLSGESYTKLRVACPETTAEGEGGRDGGREGGREGGGGLSIRSR